MRRILTELAERREPRDLPPGDTDDLVRSGFGVLVGLRIDWNLAIWDEIAAAGRLTEEDEPEAEETPETRAQAKAIEARRGRVAAETGGSVPLDLVPLAETGDVIATFLDETAGQVSGLDQIRDFIAETEDQAEGAEVVCHPAITGQGLDPGLELVAYTVAGRPLGVMALQASDLPAPPDAMRGIIGGWARLVPVPPRG